MSAAEYFADVRRASAEVERCQRMITALKSGEMPHRSSDGPRSRGDHSDPTAAAFVAMVETMDKAIKRRDMCTELLGEALVVIDALRRVYSTKADVLELYYIDLQSWAEVADHFGIAESTARYWRDQLFEWLDACPNAYVMACRYVDPTTIYSG